MKNLFRNLSIFVKKNKLVLLLVVMAFIVLAYPLFFLGIEKSFFLSIDPDIVYVTNAVLYAKSKVIIYIDHPGTPTIMLLNYSIMILRLLAKYVLHVSFVQWSFDNFAFLTYYLRFFGLGIVLFALFIFLKTVKKISNSDLITTVSFLLVLLFGGTGMASFVVPENLSFLLEAIWLFIFVKFMESRKFLWIFILVLVSGFGFANKFTFLFLGIASIFLPLYLQKTKLVQKLILIEANFAIFLQMFILGVWQIRKRLPEIVHWGISLFSYADKYGQGVYSIFDKNTYLNSLWYLLNNHLPTFIFIVSTILLEMFLIKKNKIKLGNPLLFVSFISMVGILVFSKYPTIHYNYPNIFLLIFCCSYFLTKVKVIWVKCILVVLSLFFVFNSYNSVMSVRSFSTITPKKDIKTLLQEWTPFWSGDVYRQQLDSSGYDIKDETLQEL